GAGPATQTQYVVTNHGFTFVLGETNGLAGTKGMINFRKLPSAYRNTVPFSTWRTEGGTGAQPHATCEVAALESEDAIKAWQDADPFYNYVPFQKTAAGLEDYPERWIPVVKARTGVDLATETDPAAACLAEGGTYRQADTTVTTTASLNSGFLEHETAPLTAALTDANNAKAALQTLLDGARAEVVRLAAALAPMKVALPTARIADSKLAKNGTTVTVTGPVGKAVAVKLAIGESKARKLKLPSSTLARGKAKLGSNGTAKVALKPGKSVANRIARLERSLSLKVTAFVGDRVASTTGTLTR
ncbi:MAG TPA: hypothetical protein VK631_00520, partial [Solirubrobacteraceae bacterium]|nr:hypothetical protein [Solirubrobacteraceae bacterium]